MTIRFPIPAIVSILHRISGFFLFLMIPFLVWALNDSLASPDKFLAIQVFLKTSIIIKMLLWLIASALIYHILAGLRHFMMNVGWGEELRAMRLSAWLVVILTALGSVWVFLKITGIGI